MTDERKQELRELLEAAIDNLVIQGNFDSGTISKNAYQKILRERDEFFGINEDSTNRYCYLLYHPEIVNGNIKSQLLEFIRTELNQYIEEDRIGYSTFNVDGCTQDGFYFSKRQNTQIHNLSNISDVLEYIIRMALTLGVEDALLSFEKDCSSEGRYSYYQSITSLEGIKIEKEIQAYNRVRLLPLPPDIEYKLNHDIYNRHRRGRDKGTTLLIIECLRYSVFHKPSDANFSEGQVVDLPFQVENDNIKLSNQGMVMDFRETFCQALSLACNTMVMFDYFWDYSNVDVFRSCDIEQKTWYLGPIGRKTEVGQTEIEEAKHIHNILKNCDEKTKGIFWIASERWRQSKTTQTFEDTIIDLAIAFEALYLSKGNKEQLGLSLRLRAAWFLGKNKEDRIFIYKVIKELYNCRSSVVHGGEFKNRPATIDDEQISMSEFIKKGQDICRDSILKILEQGEFPDWEDMILG